MRALPIIVVGGVAAVVAVVAWTFMRDAGDVAVTPATPAAPTATLPCEADARCVGGRHLAAAATACRPGIEDLAGYRVRWTEPAASGPRFSRFAWRDRDRGVITFSGDEAEFENAAGAFLPVTYECDFDPAQSKALEARVRQGPAR